MPSPPIHVISLARTPERLAHFTSENEGAASWSVFPAVDGREVDAAERDALGDTTLWSAGGVGAAMSHLALWRRCVESGGPLTVVEDDAILRGDFAQATAALLAGLTDYDIVLWGWNFDCVMQAEIAPGVPGVVLADQSALRRGAAAFQASCNPSTPLRLLKALGLPAYTVSMNGAAALLAACAPVRRRRLALPLMPVPLENITADMAMAHAYPGLQAFVAAPPLAATRNDWAISTVRPSAEALPRREAIARAAALEAKGEALAAIELLQAAVLREAADVELWSALGQAFTRRACHAAAAGAFERALEAEPSNAGVLYNLARVRLLQGAPAQALPLLDRAVVAAPAFALAFSNRGVARLALGHAQEAAADFRAALVLDAEIGEARRGLAAACEAQGDLDGQAFALALAAARTPDDEELLDALGEVELKRLLNAQAANDLDAASRFANSASRSPRHRVQALVAGANVAELQGRFQDACDLATQACGLEPASPHALNNLGVACLRLDRPAEAEAAYRAALERAPDYPDAHHGLAFSLLKQGRWKEGWPEYEWRLKAPRTAGWAAGFPRPLWRGERRPDATLLLAAEQGYGDSLQAASLIAEVAPKVGRVAVAVPQPLVALFRHVPGVDLVFDETTPSPPHDLWSPLMSLPGVLEVAPARVPPRQPALRLDRARADASRERLPPGPRIGVTWQGNPAARVEHGRSFPLASMAPLARGGATLVSLQKGPGVEQLAGAPFRVHVPVEPYPSGDFEETAALISALDLVVCCDTAVAHLAGLLGCPTWIVLGTNPDWRWLSERTDSVWYSKVKLWRRGADESWRDLFERIAVELPQDAAWRLAP